MAEPVKAPALHVPLCAISTLGRRRGGVTAVVVSVEACNFVSPHCYDSRPRPRFLLKRCFDARAHYARSR